MINNYVLNDLLRMKITNTNIRQPKIILGTRSLKKIGEINNIPGSSITYHPQFNATDELSFTVYKKMNEIDEPLWNRIVDFRTVYVKDYDEWFEITVNTDESEINTKKTITAKSLCEAELSQLILHNIEINTEDDIAREEYTEATVFYNPDKSDSSLLNRILEIAPHYSIAHVDSTLMNIQRSFSIDGTSVYDFLTSTLAQEIGCIFMFDTTTRSIYVYDLECTCLDCGYRSEDVFKICPECESKNIHERFGNNTPILIDKTNLGTDITLTSNADSIKNCFRIIGGDDLINATIVNVNPNGTNRTYYFNEDTLKDMPQELQNKISEYNTLTDEYLYTKKFNLDTAIVSKYNEVISYIKKYYSDTKYTSVLAEYIGWGNISSVYYDTIDVYSYLNNSMMPTFKQSEKTAESQLALLTTSNLSPIAVTDVSKISVYTANNAVLAMAKALIDTSMYKVEILDGSTLKSQTWTGKFSVKSYSVEDDKAESKEYVTIELNDDYIAFTNQKVEKAMAKLNDQGLQDIFKIDKLDDFKEEIHKYSLQRLNSYESAYQSAIDILIEQKTATTSSPLYKTIYLPYYNKLLALQDEVKFRGEQLDIITALKESLESLINATHSSLDFKKFVGEDLYKIYVSYIREDDYSNDNYVSDGLSNEELIEKVNELITVAKKELIKSGEKQYTISGSILNFLMVTDEFGNRVFENFFNDFALGNFIKVKIDKKLYDIRLSDVTINYSDITKFDVTFSDAYRIGSPTVNTVKDILSKAQSMSTSYSSVKKQASQGSDANKNFDKMLNEGLNSALYNIKNSNSTIVFDEHGLLARSWNDENNDYSPEQCRLSNNEIIYTSDNWKTAETAIGKQKYTLNGITYEEYCVNTKLLLSGKVISGDIYSLNYTTDENGVVTSGTHIDLNNGDFVFAGGKLSYSSKDNKLIAKGISIDWRTSDMPTEEIRLSSGKLSWESDYSSLDENGHFSCVDADISGKANILSGEIGGFTISSNKMYKSNIGDMLSLEFDANTYSVKSKMSIYSATLNYAALDFFIDEKRYARFNAISYEQNNSKVYGVGINSEIDSKFISFGNKNTSLDNNYSTVLLLNYGLNPNGINKDVLIMGTSYISKNLYFGGSGTSSITGFNNNGIACEGDFYITGKLQGHLTFSDGTYINSLDNGGIYISNTTMINGNLGIKSFYNNYTFSIEGDGYASQGFVSGSDRRLKHNIEEMPKYFTSLIEYINPSIYKYNSSNNKKHLGFIAQDICSAFDKIGLNYQDYNLVTSRDDGLLSLSYDELIAILWKVCQTLINNNKSIEKTLTQIKNSINEGRIKD